MTLLGFSPSTHALEHGVSSGSLLQQAPNPMLVFRPTVQDKPDAASVAAPQADGELHFVVNDFVIEGELTPSERKRVDAYVAPRRGQATTLTGLQLMRSELTELLYQNGESLVRVLLPQQTIEKNGAIRFIIVRGRIEHIEVHNSSDVSTARIEHILQGADGTRPQLRDIDARMRVLRELAGVGEVNATLSPGKLEGGTVITVSVSGGRTLYGGISADNAGSTETGARRLGMAGGINNPLGRGDRLEAMVYATPASLQNQDSAGGDTKLGRVSYDTPVGYGSLRAGAAVARVGYHLGGEFDGLGKGAANVTSVHVGNALRRTATSRLDIDAELAHKRLEDDRFDGLLQSRRESNVASIRADGSGIARPGKALVSYSYSARASYGRVETSDVDNTSNLPTSLKGENFAKLEPSLSLTLPTASAVVVGLQARGQVASRSLDGSERMSLGGPVAVRAYGLNAPAVDSGGILTFEVGRDVITGVRLSAFYDRALGEYRASFGLPSSRVDLQGAGIGINASWKNLQAQVSAARPIGKSQSEDGDQLWFTLGLAL